jgi:non-ribosomal peptide synthetase component F
VLGVLLGRDRVCIGSTFSGRSAGEADFTSVVGPFVSNLPLRVATRASDVAELARTVHDTMLELQEKQFHSSAEIQRAAGVPWLQPMFESLVVFQNYQIDQRTFDLGDTARVSAVDMPVRTNFPVTVVVVPGAESRIDLIHDAASLPEGFAEEALRLLDQWLRAAAAETTPELRTETDYVRFVAGDQQVECRAEPPQTTTERRLLEVWRELFGRSDIGITDSFFDLGGRSVMVPVLMARIEQEFATILPIVALFQNPTVRGLADRLSPEEASAAPLADRGQQRGRRSKEAIRRMQEKRGGRRGVPSGTRES